MSKKLLNVGGNNKDISLPSRYADFEHLLLDIDPAGSPDLLCDARELTGLSPAQFDVVYCSHNLEHYYRHEVPKVLAGFIHVLKEGGAAHIRVPDVIEVMRISLEKGIDIEDVLYQSPAGPVRVLDIIYGYGPEIEASGQDYYAHKTGFSSRSLQKVLAEAGFARLYNSKGHLELQAVAFKGEPEPSLLEVYELAGSD